MISSLFPVLLAGPIVRRVEVSKSFIWVATSRNVAIHADVFQIANDNYSRIPTKSTTDTIPFGENLFIHLIKITPDSGFFPANQLIGYNLHFVEQKESFDLGDLGLLTPSNPNSIVYDTVKYPTFFIPETKQDPSFKFLYGSCRKPHGEGEDTLAYGDRVLAKNIRDITYRPQALFLMGDQIYADDVADPLLIPISFLGKALMGVQEDLTSLDNRLSPEPLNKINGREYMMREFAKFTSGSASNHLIEFGEYAAKYLLSFSPVLWEIIQFESFDEAVEQGHIDFSASNQKRYTQQVENMVNCPSTAYKIRRLLANIPTYMIFDDHEITDDWNITAEWKAAVFASPFGKHVVANGLSAYWAFQGWGNQPDIYQGDFLRRIGNYFEHLRNGEMATHYDSWIDLLWQHQPWHFVAPTNPKAVFLDTRTMRGYEPHRNEVNPPQLIHKQGLKEITKQLKNSGWSKGTPLMIISPTPIIGFELIETVVTELLVPLHRFGIDVQTLFDVEGWGYNGKGLTNMLNQIAQWNPSDSIILSGDVHYGFSADSMITFSDGHSMRLKQFTSSPLKNRSFYQLGKLVKITALIDGMIQEKYRYCDSSSQIHTVEKDQIPVTEYRWKAQLNYHPVDRFFPIETENNLGILSVFSDQVEHRHVTEI